MTKGLVERVLTLRYGRPATCIRDGMAARRWNTDQPDDEALSYVGGLMIGVNTGFLVELMNGNEEAIRLRKACLNDEEETAVCCTNCSVIERFGMKGILKAWEAILGAVHRITFVVWMDRAILSQSAHLSRGLGIPAMDS